MITGSIVAIVTPMHEDGSLDLPTLRKLLDWHIAEQTDAVVIVGTTGESPTVSVEEHCALIELAVKHINGRIPVIAGTGGNSTTETIELTQYAKEVGADASLVVVPYYNRPTQEGIYQHFKKLVETVNLPTILYNVPGRTVADMHNETALRLAKIPGIIGIKDATGNLARGIDLLRLAPTDFAVYSGDDATAMALMFCGAKGNISVTANITPRLMHELCQAAMSREVERAITINNQLFPLHDKLFIEPNPLPIKWAMMKMGLIPSGIRLPLTPLSEHAQTIVYNAMRQANILS